MQLIILGFLSTIAIVVANPAEAPTPSAVLLDVCDGEDSCCTESNQCGVNQGDCDSDADCKGNLVCGNDNCNGPNFDSEDDCCTLDYNDCKIGDGVGDSEEKLEGKFTTFKGCTSAVKEQYPEANGATVDVDCWGNEAECDCYAEFGMKSFDEDDKKYASCMFHKDQRRDECKLGNGVGGNQIKLSGKYTKENCILRVKQVYFGSFGAREVANGATWDYDCPNECNCYAEFGMKSWNDDKKYASCMFIQDYYDCKMGDGEGGSEKQLTGKFTTKGCVSAVKEQEPKANGATVDADCYGTGNECNCYAEFGMKSWSDSKKYASCMFHQGDTSSVRDASDGNSTSIDNSGGDSLGDDSSGGDFSAEVTRSG